MRERGTQNITQHTVYLRGLRFNRLFSFHRTDSLAGPLGVYLGDSVLIGALSQAMHRHTLKHCPIKEAVKEAVIQQSNADKGVQQCRKPRISDASVAVRFVSHHISEGKAPHHDVMIEFGQKVQKTIQQVNRKHPVASQHMYITESVSTVASRRDSEGRAA